MNSIFKKKWWVTPLILIIIVLLLHLVALQHSWIEKIYSTYIYPPVSFFLRILTNWIPFSIGDVLYALVFVWILIAVIQFFRNQPTWKKFFLSLRDLLVKCLWVYIVFLLLWGLNYYRYGIGYKLQLYPDMYSTEDLKTITAQLREKLNTSRKLMDSLHINYADDKTTLLKAMQLYNSTKTLYPFLNYTHRDVKPMLFGTIGNYSGFLGYYNPFTGEAQVNTKVPAFIIPFTACHEIGHQLGFASESEASFVGYLAIKSGNSAVFNYSMYFDLFGFANGELYSRDSVAAKQNVKLLDTLVKKDLAEYRTYLRAYKNPLEPLLTKLYGNYLKAHNQPKGIDSYDEVVAWVIAYNKKYGKL
jgi:hypothetical protein